MFTRIKILAREPLLHFSALGLLLYVLLEAFTPQANNNIGRSIIIEPEALVQFLQFQNKSFNAQNAQTEYDLLQPNEKRRLVDDYIREEVMVREAIRLGLEKNDQIIRRRLIQKVEFINLGFQSDLEIINETELTDYFNQHQDQYTIDASVTFTHVFIDQGLHKNNTLALAEKTLATLNGAEVPFENAAQHGQRFFYHRNYVDRTPDFVNSHFGKAFSKTVFALTPGALWHGPIASNYGFHLVLLTKNIASRTPEIEEVASEVLGDLQRIKLSLMKQNALDRMIKKYTIDKRVNLESANNTSASNSTAPPGSLDASVQ